SLILWNPATGKQVRRIQGPEGRVTGLALTPDGKYLISAGGRARGKSANYAVCQWQTDTGKLVRVWMGSNLSRPVLAVSGDGRSVAVAGAQKLRVLELATGAERASFTGPLGMVVAAAFAPDGRTAVTGSDDSTLLVWDLTGRMKGGKLPPARLTNPQLEDLW